MSFMCDVDYKCGKAFDDLIAFYNEHPEMIGRSRVKSQARNALELDEDDVTDYYNSTDDFFRQGRQGGEDE